MTNMDELTIYNSHSWARFIGEDSSGVRIRCTKCTCWSFDGTSRIWIHTPSGFMRKMLTCDEAVVFKILES